MLSHQYCTIETTPTAARTRARARVRAVARVRAMVRPDLTPYVKSDPSWSVIGRKNADVSVC